MEAPQEARGGQPAQQYDTSKIGFTLPKLLGRNIRIKTEGDKKIVHVDTTIGKVLRQLVGTKYATADDAKGILNELATKMATNQEMNVHDNAVMKAAVKTMVLSGKGADEVKEAGVPLIEDAFKAREEKLYYELIQKPDIGSLSRYVWTGAKTEINCGERLKTLAEYGVDFKKQTIDPEVCSSKIAEQIAERNRDINNNPMPKRQLKEEIKVTLATAAKFGSEIPEDAFYRSVLANPSMNQNLEALNTLWDEGVGMEYFGNIFEEMPQNVQVQFLIGCVQRNMSTEDVSTLFSKMGGDAKRQFANEGVPEIQKTRPDILDNLPQVKEYRST